jgi:alkylated DNA repair protein alkB family protein 8
MLTNIETTNVKDIYEEIAKQFSDTRVHKWSWVNEFLDNLKENSLVYDIGCGNGRNMNHNKNNITFIGMDNCINFINICAQKKLNVVNGNITKIPFRQNSADAIMCVAVFHHLSNEENRIQALLEMKKLLKNDGEIILSVWSINQPAKTRRTFNSYGNNIVLWNNNKGKIYERYYYIFKIDELKKLFTKTGLYIKQHFYNCGNEIFILIKI